MAHTGGMPATAPANLTASDRKVLAVIAGSNGEVSNPDLKARHGWTLVGAQRRKLNAAGLVTSRKQGRYFVHSAKTTAEAQPVTAEARILGTVRSAGRGWMPLTRLRSTLADLDRAAQDAALKDLFRRQDLDLVPEANRKALTPADHAAAIEIGGEAKHAARIAGA